MKTPDGTFWCRNIYNIKSSSSNKKRMFLPLPNDYSVPCLKIIVIIGLTDVLIIDYDRNIKHFESSLPFFHPGRHVFHATNYWYVYISCTRLHLCHHKIDAECTKTNWYWRLCQICCCCFLVHRLVHCEQIMRWWCSNISKVLIRAYDTLLILRLI